MSQKKQANEQEKKSGSNDINGKNDRDDYVYGDDNDSSYTNSQKCTQFFKCASLPLLPSSSKLFADKSGVNDVNQPEYTCMEIILFIHLYVRHVVYITRANF